MKRNTLIAIAFCLILVAIVGGAASSVPGGVSSLPGYADALAAARGTTPGTMLPGSLGSLAGYQEMLAKWKGMPGATVYSGTIQRAYSSYPCYTLTYTDSSQTYTVRIGRDRMFEELRKRDLLLEPVAAEYPRTTQSYHNLPVFRNLVKDQEVQGPNEVWVSDLIYLRTVEGFLFLALITDKYSRKIVGWHVGDNLEAVGCVRALERALEDLPPESRPIHHSDQGSQYCCHQYVNQLQEHGLGISMTESTHCGENALAERMNGILKQEYGLGLELPGKETAYLAARQGIGLYNTRRPHRALDYRIPAQVHAAGLN